MSLSEDFSEPGTGAVDYRINRDSAGPPNNWRRETPPAGEDGSVPDRRITVTGGTALEGAGVNMKLYPSTFDIPDSEMG